MKKIFQLSQSILLGLIFLSAPATVHATSYYVSSAGVNTGTCASTQPCTFARAQSLSVAGDTINISGKIGAINITKPGLIVRGGIVDGANLSSADSAAVLISANDVTIEDMEIINGWSYGFRSINNIRNITARRLNIHNNVRENFASSGIGCKTSTTSGWGSAMRAYFVDGLSLSDSYLWENCGEGFSAVMSKNIHGQNLTIWDNWSVGAYPDQTDTYSLTNSAIHCVKPEFQRDSRNRSILLGAEDGYGTSINITKNITFTNNKFYNCKGALAYSTTSGEYANVLIKDNTFYNTYGQVIGSIPGTNIVTTPNIATTLSVLPVPTVRPIASPTQTPLASPTPKPWTSLEADYSTWLSHYLQTVIGFINGDFSENGVVDGIDYVIWVNKYGH